MRRLLIICLLVVFAAGACGAAPVIRQKQFARRSYCNIYDLLKLNRYQVNVRKNDLTGTAKNRALVFGYKQRRFQYNRRRVELCCPMVYSGNQAWISVLDWQKTLRPLLYPATVPAHKIGTVYLDVGHGGDDPGAIGAFSREKNITLTLGLRTAAILRSYGYKVVMTRSFDTYVSPAQVCVQQKRSKSDLFVSIHVNSAKDRNISGIETFCLTPAGVASSNGGKADPKSYPGNRFDSNNILLAWHVQQALLNTTGGSDRGIKRARFAVLKDLDAPGVLVEVGFISNRAEERRLNQRVYQDNIARGIALGIVNYSRSLRKK